jgi:hypothetical protein
VPAAELVALALAVAPAVTAIDAADATATSSRLIFKIVHSLG